MELRYRLVVVTGAGHGLGREVGVRLGRAGARLLLADADLGAVEETAGLVRAHRTWAAVVQAGPTEEYDAHLLAARVRDVGRASAVLDTAGGPYADLLRALLTEAPGAADTPPVWLDRDALTACDVDETVRRLRRQDRAPSR